MQRDGQLDDAEAGAEMAAGDRDGVDRLGAQLVGELAELALVERPQVGGRGDPSRSGVTGFVTKYPRKRGAVSNMLRRKKAKIHQDGLRGNCVSKWPVRNALGRGFTRARRSSD